MMPSWVALLVRALKGEIPKDFVGQVEVNVFKGGVSNVMVKQSYKGDGNDTKQT
jgi:hypothetical protein